MLESHVDTSRIRFLFSFYNIFWLEIVSNHILVLMYYFSHFLWSLWICSQKSWQGQNPKSDSSGSASASASGSPQLNNGTMVYVGSMDESELWSAGSTHGPESQTIAGFVSITIAVWLLCHLY